MARQVAKPIPVAKLKELLHYNPETGIFRWKVRPFANSKRRAGDEAGSQEKPYRRVMIEGRHYSLHRLAYAFVYGEQPPMVDHINGETHDNRIGNLRAATPAQNQQNRKPPEGKAVPYPGVHIMSGRCYRRKSDGKIVVYQRSKPYAAKIRVNGKLVQLGQYATAIEAAMAYEKAARKFFGEFAASAGRLPSVFP